MSRFKYMGLRLSQRRHGSKSERSWRVVVTCVWLCVASFTHTFGEDAAPSDNAELPRLVWRNGDLLSGQLESATADRLTWRSPVFAEPLLLDSTAIHMIGFPAQPIHTEETDIDVATQVIETRDGNRFYGFVEKTTPDHVYVQTELYGDIEIDRNAVAIISNPVKRAHVYEGPDGLEGWSTLTYGRRLSEWEEIAGGRLRTKMVAAELYRTLPANGSVDIDIEVAWRHNPSFQIRFLTPYQKPTKETIKVETRVGNHVIQSLASNGRFKQLEAMEKSVTRCRLLLRWNHIASELAVFRGHKLLGKIAVAKQKNAAPAGIYIKNSGPQLSLNKVSIRAGSTLDASVSNSDLDTVLRADNDSVSGKVVDFDGESLSLLRDGLMTKLPWDEVAEVSFCGKVGSASNGAAVAENDDTSPSDNDTTLDTSSLAGSGESDASSESDGQPAGKAECVFQNGETLKGELVSATAKDVLMLIPAVTKPVRCSFAVLERIILNPRSTPPPKGTASIVLPGESFRTLHGTLAAGAEEAVAWLPTGGVQPARLRREQAVEFRLRSGVTSSIGRLTDDLVFLECGDVLPCRVKSATSESLQLDTPFTGVKTLGSQSVKAVELSARPVEAIEGFDDRWEVALKDRATVKAKQIEYVGATTVSRQGVMKGCDQLEFEIDKLVNKNSGVFLNIKFSKLKEEGDTTIPFYFIGEKTYVMGGDRRNAFVPVLGDKKRMHVKIETRDPFAISVDGELIYSMNTPENMGHWDNVSFNVSYSAAPMMRRKLQKTAQVTLSNLKISQTKRPSISHVTSTLESEPLLTIPRHHDGKSRLTHLAIGINNDVVRGGLVSVNPNDVQMQVNTRQVSLARDSVAGMVWLNPELDLDSDVESGSESELEQPSGGPSEVPIVAELGDFVRVVLLDTTTITLHNPRLKGSAITGEHPDLGACSIAVDRVQKMFWGNTPSQHRHDFLSWRAKQAQQPILSAQERRGHQMASPLVGQQIPFEATLADGGGGFSLQEQQGKIVVLDFWASWCAPCIKNMPRLIEAVSAFPKSEVRLFAVNQGESAEIVSRIVETKGWSVAAALDPKSSAATAFQVSSIPTTVVIDQQGLVAAVYVGASKLLQEELSTKIRELLTEASNAK